MFFLKQTYKNCAIIATSTVLIFGLTLQADIITFDENLLASGSTISSNGLTMTATTVGGSISNITAGQFTGLWFGGANNSGTYQLSFSQVIESIEIEFDALSDVGVLPVETITNFLTSNGPITISYVNQFGTTFDGTTITSTENDGQGIINFSGIPFSSFIFDHNQGMQNGFVIERIVVNTETQSVPEPNLVLMIVLGISTVGLIAGKRNKI